MLYVVRRLRGMSLLPTLADSTNTAYLHVPVVLNTIARQLPQDIQTFAIDVSDAPMPQFNKLDLQGRTARTVSKLHSDRAQHPASRFLSAQLLHR